MWMIMDYLTIGAIFFWVVGWALNQETKFTYNDRGEWLHDFLVTVLIWPLLGIVVLYVLVCDWLGQNPGEEK